MMLKDITRTAKMLSTYHRPNGEPNIFLFSTPRSGSTWLMSLLHTQPDFRLCREPFDLRQTAVCEHLGITDWVTLYDDAGVEQIAAYFDALDGGQLRDKRFKYVRPFGKQRYRFLTHRTIYKILHAGEHRINWFRDTYNGRIVYLVRHPIPVTLSREVYPRLDAFLQSDYRKLLTARELRGAQAIVAGGSDFQRGILDWCLQNSVPLRQATDDWVIVTYEQLVLEPAAVIATLGQRLQLPHPERLFAALNIPSGSTGKSDVKTQQVLAQGRSEAKQNWLVEKWLSQVTAQQQQAAQAILDLFGLNLYHSQEPLPDQTWWLRADGVAHHD